MFFKSALAALSLLVVGAHLTGHLKSFGRFFDIGIETQHIPYLLVIPFVCVVGLVMLSDGKNT